MVNSVSCRVCPLCLVFGYASLVRQRHALEEKTRKYLIIYLLLTVFVLQPLMDIELESPSVGRVGFYNEGNSCFLNAACQVCVSY